MNGNKHQDRGFKPSPTRPTAAANEPVSQSSERHQLAILAGRAVATYLVLCFMMALVMSVSGIDPLLRQGLMPKGLLLFVGLATILAAANIITADSQEHSFTWRNVALHLLHSFRQSKR